MPLEWITCEQGSPEWHEARLGIPTASRFADVLAQGKKLVRGKYMRELAGEIITGTMAEGYSNAAMERGKDMESQARAEYEFMYDVDIAAVGFARNGRAGASPDGLLPNGWPVEFKSKLPHLLIECIERGELPTEHKAQVQGAMWITETDHAAFAAYWPGLPLFAVTVARDDEYIATLASEIIRFNDELDTLVARVKSYVPTRLTAFDRVAA